jgi:hypothetical protein
LDEFAIGAGESMHRCLPPYLLLLALGVAHSDRLFSADLIIYDNATENGFDQTCSSGGVASDFDFANASPVYDGSDSIRFTPDNFNAVGWCAPSAYSALDNHSGISFWVYLSGDASEAANVDLVLAHAGADVTAQTLQALYGATIPTGEWVQIQALFPAAPLSYAGLFDQIVLRDESGSIQSDIYIDDVALAPADRVFSGEFETPAPVYMVGASVNGGNGSIAPASQLVDSGSTATFSVVPVSHYVAHVAGGTCTVARIGASDTWASNAIGQDCTVTASFSQMTFNLTLGMNGNGLGMISPSPTGTSCGTNCYTYVDGTPVSITATPSVFSSFAGFSGGGCSNTSPCMVQMTAPTSVTATFNLQRYNLTVATGGAGSGTVTTFTTSPSGTSCGTNCETYDYGTNVQVTAHPAAGSAFSSFTGGGCFTTNPCTVTVTNDTTVTANFSLTP